MPVACVESIKPTEIMREEPPLDYTQQKQMASQHQQVTDGCSLGTTLFPVLS